MYSSGINWLSRLIMIWYSNKNIKIFRAKYTPYLSSLYENNSQWQDLAVIGNGVKFWSKEIIFVLNESCFISTRHYRGIRSLENWKEFSAYCWTSPLLTDQYENWPSHGPNWLWQVSSSFLVIMRVLDKKKIFLTW